MSLLGGQYFIGCIKGLLVNNPKYPLSLVRVLLPWVDITDWEKHSDWVGPYDWEVEDVSEEAS